MRFLHQDSMLDKAEEAGLCSTFRQSAMRAGWPGFQGSGPSERILKAEGISKGPNKRVLGQM